MVASRFRIASARVHVALGAAAGLALAGGPALRDAVVWYEDDRRDIPQPRVREAPNVVRDGLEETLYRPLGRLLNPARMVRRVATLFGGDHVAPAANVNRLDEVLNSTWFTNRIGLFPLSPAEVARGPTRNAGPDQTSPWTVLRPKTEGLSPGFDVRDARGDVYIIKFDPPGGLGLTTAPGVISGRILHAAGYNVPEDFVVTFRREDVVVGEGARIRGLGGERRAMTAGDLDSILARADRLPNGAWRALASKFLPGTPIGPFSWVGRRDDDPNDRVRHEDRRELRGFEVFATWLCHFDTKQGNTLDMYVEEQGRRFVRHHFIDFASTLGAGATGAFPLGCFEYQFDAAATLGRALSLGLHQDAWRRLERPEGLPEVGYFESEMFDPGGFKPLNPNSAFANVTDRDGYWAAKIVSAFSDAHLEAVVAEGRYRDPAAARWVARVLAERRDETARYWFDRVPPLDFFTVERGVIRFRDLGVERGIYPASLSRHRARAAAVDAGRDAERWSAWTPVDRLEIPLDLVPAADEGRFPFAAVQVQVGRGGGWSRTVTTFVARAGGRVLAVER